MSKLRKAPATRIRLISSLFPPITDLFSPCVLLCHACRSNVMERGDALPRGIGACSCLQRPRGCGGGVGLPAFLRPSFGARARSAFSSQLYSPPSQELCGLHPAELLSKSRGGRWMLFHTHTQDNRETSKIGWGRKRNATHNKHAALAHAALLRQRFELSWSFSTCTLRPHRPHPTRSGHSCRMRKTLPTTILLTTTLRP